MNPFITAGQRTRLSALRGPASALLAALGLLAAAPAAHAVPSFARQTGADCAACHVGAFGPQLTPYGIKFKIGGYTETDGKAGKVPLSAMIVGSYTQTKKDQAKPENGSVNKNLALDEASLFLAGRLTDKIGAFIQATYDGVGRTTSLDQVDIRAAHTLEIAGKETIIGLSLNNNPGVQDPFNTMSVWSFPYSGSPYGFGMGGASTLINGGLEQRVTGLSAYTFWNNLVYAEVGTYRSLPVTMQSRFGLGKPDTDERLSAGTTYWRLAAFQDLKKQAFNVGMFGLNTTKSVRGEAGGNKFNDLGVDASYQFLGTRKHVATVNTSYIREHQTLNQLYAGGEAENRKGRLNEFKFNTSYHYDQTWGATIGRFLTNGTSDAIVYADGFANASPNSSGYIMQADWTPWGKESSFGAPWANVRFGAQYTMYTKYNGAKNDYDGTGRNAKDNNTLFLFAWTSF
jgi:hypothetical protein